MSGIWGTVQTTNTPLPSKPWGSDPNIIFNLIIFLEIYLTFLEIQLMVIIVNIFWQINFIYRS